MSITGDVIYVQGRKLYERSDGYYQDERGRVFDYRGTGKLYEQQYSYGPKYPPTWYWICPTPVVDSVADRILEQVEGF